MQKAINRWERGLKCTGGAIRPDKSFVCPISLKWDNQGDYSFENPEDLGIELTVNNKFNEREELKQFHPRKEYETLGVFMGPDVSQTDQLREISKKATSWADKIITGYLP